MKPYIVIDFETEEILPRPKYPPFPVGVAIKEFGKEAKYLSWGHPTGNNCTFEEGKNEIHIAFGSGKDLIFHNSKFDIDVAQNHIQVPEVNWSICQDTMVMLFILEPYAESLGLKQSAERLLDFDKSEQEEVRQWLINHSLIKKSKKDWGGMISKAPGDLVGRYAIGDVVRTEALFNLLMSKIESSPSLKRAYNREMELIPYFIKEESKGVRFDSDKLSRESEIYQTALNQADDWIRKFTNTPILNLDSGRELAKALDEFVIEWRYTPTGKLSTAKDVFIPSNIRDENLANMLGYRGRLRTLLNTFILPWQSQNEESGRFYTIWNQTRNDFGSGARTGRLSNSPSLMNIPNPLEDKGDGYKHPTCIQLPPLPHIRDYLLPDEGGVWLSRDYNQQELRILAHYEDGKLLNSYKNNPKMDVHTFVQEEITRMFGFTPPRKAVKILNFGLIYGMGVGKLAESMGVSEEEAKRFKKAHNEAIPGLKALNTNLMRIGKDGGFITTWGGRRYYSEDPRYVGNRLVSFDYKLLNYLIQGSAADCTKTALLNYFRRGEKLSRFLLTVHDQIDISSPEDKVKEEMGVLRESMESVEFEVPMLSDGSFGKSWGSLEGYDE